MNTEICCTECGQGLYRLHCPECGKRVVDAAYVIPHDCVEPDECVQVIQVEIICDRRIRCPDIDDLVSLLTRIDKGEDRGEITISADWTED